MYVLGINGGVRLGYQDIAACLMHNGRVCYAIEEERLNRIKFSPGQIPELSIKECLKQEGISIREVDFIASHGITWGKEYADKLKDYFVYNFGYCPPIEFVHHHDAHAASTFWGSGFDKAMIVSYDSSGDGVSTQLSVGDGSDIKLIKRYSRPNSLGIFYTMMTQFCGFRRDSDEYKLMGLSAYGNKTAHSFDNILHFNNGEYELNEEFLKTIAPGASQPTKQEMIFSDKLIKLLGEKRIHGSEISKKYMDIAASAQHHLENVIIQLIEDFHKRTGLRKICLSGGVALNCLVNQKIMNLDFIDDIYVTPAAGDAGVAKGAAMIVSNKNGYKPLPINSALLGNSFTNNDIEEILKSINVKYEKCLDVADYAAKLVAGNALVGWFQDRMEFGPRALGARSIIANPAMPDVKNVINKKIKFRESFRPFCPSVTIEDHKKYFIGKASKVPFMNITYEVAENVKNIIHGAVHIDGTARIQTVDKHHSKFYNLIKNFESYSGFPVVVNTSFNTNNEPIVCTPYDAIACFYRSGLDALVVGDYVLKK